MDLNEIGLRCYEWTERMGWHNKTPLECLGLICSEAGEAMNEVRGEQPTPHFAEELADIILRTTDLAVQHNIDLTEECLKKMAKNEINGTRGRLK